MEKIFVYNPAKSLIISAVAHDNTERVIFEAQDLEDSQYFTCDIKNSVYTESLLFSGPCEVLMDYDTTTSNHFDHSGHHKFFSLMIK